MRLRATADVAATNLTPSSSDSDMVQGVFQSPLVLAVMGGDMELVKMLIANHADLNAPGM